MSAPLFSLPRLAAVLTLPLFLLTRAGSAEPAATPGLDPLVVEVAPVEFSAEPVPVDLPGVLSRRAEATLSFKTGGLVASVAVRAGDTVRAGQVLASLRLDEIDAQVAGARTALDKAQRDADRVAALHADRVATLENLQDSRSAVEVAAASLRAAEFNRQHSVITAPADGRILRRLAEPDEMVAAGHAILGFAADADGWLVRAGVPETEVVRLHLGDAATVAVDGQPAVAATLTQIAEAADSGTRTVEVEVQPAGPVAPGQRSGFIVRVSLRPQPGAVRPAVPLAAVVEGRARQAFLYLLSADGKTVRRQSVEIEAIDGPRAYLRTPLAAGTRVVTSGAEFLTDGRSVTVARPNP